MRTSNAQIIGYGLCVAIVIGGAGQAIGQQFRMPSGVALPSKALTEVTGPKGRAETIWCNQSVTLRSGPDANSALLKKRMQFLESAQVAYRHLGVEGKTSLLLCYTTQPDSLEIAPSGLLLGWVDEDKVLLSTSAEMVKRGGKASVIHRKGMAVIRKESVDLFGPRGIFVPKQLAKASTGSQALDGKTNLSATDEVEKVLTFQAPRLMTAEDPPSFVRPIPLSSFYFVFRQTRGLPLDFVLVGTSQNFKPDRPDDVVTGWLPLVNHADWNNRFGYEWNAATYGSARKEKGFVFIAESQARDFIDSTASFAGGLDPAGAVYEEFIDKATRRSVELPHNALRMPQVDDVLVPVRDEVISKVGWLGSAGQDPRAQADTMAKIVEQKRQSRQLDVMFLIDHTQTMEPHFINVADAVNQIVTNLRDKYLNQNVESDDSRTMRVSISFYGDERTEAKALIREFATVTKTAQPLAITPQQRKAFASAPKLTVEEMLAELSKHPSRGGGGIEEDLLIGLHYAVKMFPDNDGRKLLFVIGDMGDKNVGSEFDRKAGIIAQMLSERSVPIRMIALQVKTKASLSPEAAKVAASFKQQLQTVISMTNAILTRRGATREEIDLSKVIPIGDRAALIDEIGRSYAALQAAIARFQRALATNNPSLLTGTERRRLESEGIELDKLQHPLFRVGYVANRPRTAALVDAFQAPDVTQVRRRILMSYDDLKRLEYLVGLVVKSLERDGGGDQSLGSLFRAEVGSTFAEQSPIGSMSEAFDLKASIRLKSRILTTIFSEIDNARFSDQELTELKAAHETLKDILNGKRHEWVAKQVEYFDHKSMRRQRKWEAKPTFLPPQDVTRGFTQPGDPDNNVWYWLVENEIP